MRSRKTDHVTTLISGHLLVDLDALSEDEARVLKVCAVTSSRMIMIIMIAFFPSARQLRFSCGWLVSVRNPSINLILYETTRGNMRMEKY